MLRLIAQGLALRDGAAREAVGAAKERGVELAPKEGLPLLAERVDGEAVPPHLLLDGVAPRAAAAELEGDSAGPRLAHAKRGGSAEADGA